MDEYTTQRWLARIGDLKGGCAILMIIALLVAGVAGVMAYSAFRNPDTPQPVTITQLVEGEVGSGRYVEVEGIAFYDARYDETEDDEIVANYYLLVDDFTADIVLVKHPTAYIIAPEEGPATIRGMTRSMPLDLKNLVKEDAEIFTESGVRTTTRLYVADGQAPPSKTSSLMLLLLGLAGVGVGSLPLFFPSNVFVSYPLDPNVLPPTTRPPVEVTAEFYNLKSMEPLMIGKRTRKFNKAVANVIHYGEGAILLYIHHVLKTKTYGVTVNTTETDWGLMLTTDNVRQVAAGKLLGWKERWAVRFLYLDDKGRQREAFVLLKDTAGQMALVNLLQNLGFSVTAAGDAPSL